MARYLYWCNACNQQFEVEKMMEHAGNIENCPACKANAQRIFTAPGISIKGSVVKSVMSCESRGASDGCSGGCCGGNCAHD